MDEYFLFTGVEYRNTFINKFSGWKEIRPDIQNSVRIPRVVVRNRLLVVTGLSLSTENVGIDGIKGCEKLQLQRYC